jgi:hypothetical protein
MLRSSARNPARYVRLLLVFGSTLTAILIAFALWRPIFGLDWIELALKPLSATAKWEVFSGCAILVGLGMDCARALRRKRYRSEMEAQKLETLKVTMRTVQHIVNTFLNDLILLEIEAAHLLPQDVLDRLDDSVQQVAGKLKALGDVESVHEKPLGAGLGVEYLE